MVSVAVGAGILSHLLVGKGVTIAGGHLLSQASLATVQHLGQHAFINTLAAIQGASTLTGAASAGFSGGKALSAFTLELATRKEQNEKIAAMRPGSLGEIPGDLRPQLIEIAWKCVEAQYARLGIKDDHGNVKTKLSQIRPNVRKNCLDFNKAEGGDNCTCGYSMYWHEDEGHSPLEPDISLLVLATLAEVLYPELFRRDAD